MPVSSSERLSAALFIQVYAVDRILVLASFIEDAKPVYQDPFATDRRFEQRFPKTVSNLPRFVQGCERIIESALAILCFLDDNFDVNAAMKREIEILCSIT